MSSGKIPAPANDVMTFFAVKEDVQTSDSRPAMSLFTAASCRHFIVLREGVEARGGEVALENAECAHVQGLGHVGEVRWRLKKVDVVIHGKNSSTSRVTWEAWPSRIRTCGILLSFRSVGDELDVAEGADVVQEDWPLHGGESVALYRDPSGPGA